MGQCKTLNSDGSTCTAIIVYFIWSKEGSSCLRAHVHANQPIDLGQGDVALFWVALQDLDHWKIPSNRDRTTSRRSIVCVCSQTITRLYKHNN